MNKTVAILTPTYNRKYIIEKLINSLKQQTCRDFKWYVIDDGSTDGIDKLFESVQDFGFETLYVKKPNGGKHTAINFAMNYITEELTFIVDSDDYLSSDAVQSIVDDWSAYKSYDNICGLSYYRIRPDNEIIGQKYIRNEVVFSTLIDYRINRNNIGDKAEIYKTDILKKFPFPEFNNEKFLSESVVWIAIANAGHRLAFIPKGIYYCEYILDGLTMQGRKKQLDCPLGTIEHAKSFFYHGIKTTIKLKYMCMLIAICKAKKIPISDKINEKHLMLLYLITFIPGSILGLYWASKYRD